MFFYKVEGHMPKLSSFGRGKKFRPKKSLTSLLQAALQLKGLGQHCAKWLLGLKIESTPNELYFCVQTDYCVGYIVPYLFSVQEALIQGISLLLFHQICSQLMKTMNRRLHSICKNSVNRRQFSKTWCFDGVYFLQKGISCVIGLSRNTFVMQWR